MRRIILNIILIPLLTLLPAATFAAPAYAACGNSDAAKQVSNGLGEVSSTPCNDTGVNGAISLAVNILSLVVGAAAVITLIWAGFKYITSGGDTNKVANAKSTLIYAIVGIAVVGLTQVLVHLVLSSAASVK
jgi:uncharacterized membrane protein YuzA (DUF378 family)